MAPRFSYHPTCLCESSTCVGESTFLVSESTTLGGQPSTCVRESTFLVNQSSTCVRESSILPDQSSTCVAESATLVIQSSTSVRQAPGYGQVVLILAPWRSVSLDSGHRCAIVPVHRNAPAPTCANVCGRVDHVDVRSSIEYTLPMECRMQGRYAHAHIQRSEDSDIPRTWRMRCSSTSQQHRSSVSLSLRIRHSGAIAGRR